MNTDFTSQYEAIQAMAMAGDKAGAAAELDKLQDGFTTEGDLAGLTACLIRRDRLVGDLDTSAVRDLLKKTARREQKILLDQIALGKVALTETLRRLEFLLALKVGDPVLDKDWGFGVIKRVDLFYAKLCIDYAVKAGHVMTLASAAESIRLAPEDHILTRNYRDRAGLLELIKTNPGEVLKMALRSYGNSTIPRLEDLLCSTEIMTRAEWKTFWEGARKALKSDPLIFIPAKRTELVQLLNKPMTYDDEWLLALKKNRSMTDIYRKISDYADELDGSAMPENFKEVILDRLAFALKGAKGTDAVLYASFAVLSSRLGLEPVSYAEMRAHLSEGDRFITALNDFGAKVSRAFLNFMLVDPEVKHLVIASFPEMTLAALGETMTVLGDDPEVRDYCAMQLQSVEVMPTLLVWAVRNFDAIVYQKPEEGQVEKGWLKVQYGDMLMQVLHVIEQKLTGESLRMRNILQDFFDSAKWFETEAWPRLDAFQRQMLFQRVQASPSWEAGSHRALMSRLAKLMPELAKVKKSALMTQNESARRTSWHSLGTLQNTLDHLIKVRVPKNNADIAAARELGDLRENFEYQSAKELQRTLLAQQTQISMDLKALKGTDFSDAKTDFVMPGVRVTYQDAEGRSSSYVILGEIDNDPELGIISNKSRLAMALLGKKVGETAEVPSGVKDKTVVVTVTEIRLPEESVKTWIKSVPAPLAE